MLLSTLRWKISFLFEEDVTSKHDAHSYIQKQWWDVTKYLLKILRLYFSISIVCYFTSNFALFTTFIPQLRYRFRLYMQKIMSLYRVSTCWTSQNLACWVHTSSYCTNVLYINCNSPKQTGLAHYPEWLLISQKVKAVAKMCKRAAPSGLFGNPLLTCFEVITQGIFFLQQMIVKTVQSTSLCTTKLKHPCRVTISKMLFASIVPQSSALGEWPWPRVEMQMWQLRMTHVLQFIQLASKSASLAWKMEIVCAVELPQGVQRGVYLPGTAGFFNSRHSERFERSVKATASVWREMNVYLQYPVRENMFYYSPNFFAERIEFPCVWK